MPCWLPSIRAHAVATLVRCTLISKKSIFSKGGTFGQNILLLSYTRVYVVYIGIKIFAGNCRQLEKIDFFFEISVHLTREATVWALIEESQQGMIQIKRLTHLHLLPWLRGPKTKSWTKKAGKSSVSKKYANKKGWKNRVSSSCNFWKEWQTKSKLTFPCGGSLNLSNNIKFGHFG